MADASARDPLRDDLGPLIHEEIDRLPGRYRAPIVLCFLEGLTREQAAGQLRWPLGTLQSRLARGRQRLRERLIRRGVAPSAILPGAVLRAELARAVVTAAMADSTAQAAMTSAAGRPTIVGSISAPAALTQEVLKAMWFHKLRMIAAGMIAGAGLAAGAVAAGSAWALRESRPDPPAAGAHQPAPATEDQGTPEGDSAGPAPVEGAPSVLKYGDGQADGKQSLGGSGEMITFSAPAAPARVKGLRVHGSRYGNPQPPDESFLIYFLSEDRKRILHTEMAPYSLFERGSEQWVEVTFERPVELPKTFWVVLDFRANQNKGVYVSFDASTGGRHSLVGLPGTPTSRPRRGGDWMIEAVLAE
jgi:RNA polymerase sigma-70 factor (ECF subfamily)